MLCAALRPTTIYDPCAQYTGVSPCAARGASSSPCVPLRRHSPLPLRIASHHGSYAAYAVHALPRAHSLTNNPRCVCTTSHTPRLTAGGGVYHSCCPPSPPLAKPARAPFSRERHSHATPSHATPSHVICATAVSAPTLLLLPARGDMDAHSRSFFAASARPR